jgi:serine protease Do
MPYAPVLRRGVLLVSLAAFALLSPGVPTLAARNLPEFTRLVEQQRAAVVNISTTVRRQPLSASAPNEGRRLPGFSEDAPFNDPFKRFFGEGDVEQFDTESLGSGFILSTDGYVLTNNHVIESADKVVVRLGDHREFEARVIGADRPSDVALLKIESQTPLPAVKVMVPTYLKVGEWVLAIGSPFGFDHSVTAGIVSAKGRSLPGESYVPFIQTDVAINPGNSGGPLFNLEGEVVGVNSQIFSRTGGFMGLSFAIPIDVVMDVADQLRAKGHFSRGWLGVLIQDISGQLAESMSMEKPKGALVAKVLSDSPAERAGLRVGDVVVAFNEHAISRSSELPPIVGRTPVNAQVPVTIVRGGERQLLRVVVGELPKEKSVRLKPPVPPRVETTMTGNLLGLAVIDLTAEQRARYRLPGHGVVIERVELGPAYDAGIRTGDILLLLDGVEVTDSDEFERLVAELPVGRAVSALVQRGRDPLFFALKPPQ